MNSRDKGKRGERDAARCLEGVLGMPARRGVQYQGGPDSPDVLVDGLGLHFEVKYSSRLRIYDAMEQATGDSCLTDKVPVVLYRRPGRLWLWIHTLADTMAVHEEIRQARNAKAVRSIAYGDGGTGDGSQKMAGL